MITVFRNISGLISTLSLEAGAKIPSEAVWIDMVSPTAEEKIALETQLNIQIPSSEEIWKNHVLNRLYMENGISYINAAIITKVGSAYPQTSPVIFILAAGFLVTIRTIEPTSFNNFYQGIQNSAGKFSNGSNILEGLMEEIIVRVAHNSEIVVEELDTLSHEIFDPVALENFQKSPSQVMQDTLRRLGMCADLNSKINESLHSISRMLKFIRDTNEKDTELYKDICILVTDSDTLMRQTGFLADKITFQLDATLGMINVEQNMIIKIFSVVAVFFLPPTLVSSIYGMNFANMPELHWIHGYPFAIFLMAVFALGPFMYFRKRGWL